MKSMFSRINIPTAVAVLAFVALDRYFDITGTALTTVGLTPKR